MNIINATIAPYAPEPTVAEQQAKIIELESDLQSMTTNWKYAAEQLRETRQKVDNVKGHILDLQSQYGEVDDEILEIARLLDITLTKEISGTATFEISWTAQVPMQFDPSDFEISFSVECDTYEAEDFDWSEENSEVNAEEM